MKILSQENLTVRQYKVNKIALHAQEFLMLAAAFRTNRSLFRSAQSPRVIF